MIYQIDTWKDVKIWFVSKQRLLFYFQSIKITKMPEQDMENLSLGKLQFSICFCMMQLTSKLYKQKKNISNFIYTINISNKLKFANKIINKQ